MRRTIRIPKGDAAIAAALSQRFRAGDLYAYTYDNATWTTWATETDWLATERNGTIRAAANGHGPCDWARDELVASLGVDAIRPRQQHGLTKAQLVAKLRALVEVTPEFELPDAITELLGAA